MTITENAPNTPATPPGPAYRLSGVTRMYRQKGRAVTPVEGVNLEIAAGTRLAVLEALNAEGLTIIVVTDDTAVAARARRRLWLEKGTIHDITRRR